MPSWPKNSEGLVAVAPVFYHSRIKENAMDMWEAITECVWSVSVAAMVVALFRYVIGNKG